ncbi:MAG: hypothetical protein ACTIJ9_11470 [Aequorivita sp.]
MTFNIKTRIKAFVDQRVKEVKKHQNRTQQIALDYAQISNLFPESNFIPFTGWSISPSVILHILNDIVINKRCNIIEFGSGASTLYIARLIQTLKLDAKFYSVESSDEWLQKMKGQLALYNLEDVVTLVYAPLKEAPKEFCLNEQKLWYDTGKIESAIADIKEFDLVIVDGPFGGSTPYARYSAIPFLKSRLSSNFAVFLDDAARAHENEIITHWSELLKLKSQDLQRYVYFRNETSFETTPYRLPK